MYYSSIKTDRLCVHMIYIHRTRTDIKNDGVMIRGFLQGPKLIEIHLARTCMWEGEIYNLEFRPITTDIPWVYARLLADFRTSIMVTSARKLQHTYIYIYISAYIECQTSGEWSHSLEATQGLLHSQPEPTLLE